MSPEQFVELAGGIGRAVLAASADDVDQASRFPGEALRAMKDAGLLGALVPVARGGLGMSVDTVARSVCALSSYCSSAAMVYAMHQIQVACLVRHGTTPALLQFQERVAREGLLLASATTETGIGGDVRSSRCAVVQDAGRFTLSKLAPVISYGEYADAVFVTARRAPESPPSDQVLVLCEPGSFALEPTSTWDALGFRGTCSRGFSLTAEGAVDGVFPEAYGEISSVTMLPVSHVLWSSLWLGIASAAEHRARTFVQAQARKTPDVTPLGAMRLAELAEVYQQFYDLVEGGRRRLTEAQRRDDYLRSVGFTLAMNTLKVSASTLVVDVVQRAMLICGMAGFSNVGPFSLGRLLRDAYGAQLMVNNDRIHSNNSQLLLIHRGASS